MCLSIKSDFEKCLCISLVIFKVLYHEHFAQQLHVNILVVVSNQKYPYSEWCKPLSNIPDSENGNYRQISPFFSPIKIVYIIYIYIFLYFFYILYLYYNFYLVLINRYISCRFLSVSLTPLVRLSECCLSEQFSVITLVNWVTTRRPLFICLLTTGPFRKLMCIYIWLEWIQQYPVHGKKWEETSAPQQGGIIT